MLPSLSLGIAQHRTSPCFTSEVAPRAGCSAGFYPRHLNFNGNMVAFSSFLDGSVVFYIARKLFCFECKVYSSGKGKQDGVIKAAVITLQVTLLWDKEEIPVDSAGVVVVVAPHSPTKSSDTQLTGGHF